MWVEFERVYRLTWQETCRAVQSVGPPVGYASALHASRRVRVWWPSATAGDAQCYSLKWGVQRLFRLSKFRLRENSVGLIGWTVDQRDDAGGCEVQMLLPWKMNIKN